MMSLLSVSRVLIFTNTIKTSKFPIFVKLSVVCILSWVVYVFLYGCITQNFMFVPPGWAYDLDAPHAAIFAHLEIGLSFLSLTISYLSYLAIDYIIRVVEFSLTYIFHLFNFRRKPELVIPSFEKMKSGF